jgi:hypothetical protein
MRKRATLVDELLAGKEFDLSIRVIFNCFLFSSDLQMPKFEKAKFPSEVQ